jgi:hypothetical protein
MVASAPFGAELDAGTDEGLADALRDELLRVHPGAWTSRVTMFRMGSGEEPTIAIEAHHR